MTTGRMRRSGWALAVSAALALGAFLWSIARFFPNPAGRLGYDYGLYVPWMVAGDYWRAKNGLFSSPEYLPSFCAGTPFAFNPQSLYFSVPQWLSFIMSPVAALLVTGILFAVVGAIGLYALLRRLFEASVAASTLGAVLFLLNGFFVARMALGHVTFSAAMLLPLVALALFLPRSAADTGRRLPIGIAARCLWVGAMMAYVIYSGGVHLIIPMALTLAMIAALVALGGRWHRDIKWIALIGGLLWLALSAYKMGPALAFAANVTRLPVLRMIGNPVVLLGAAFTSLFVPQGLAFVPPKLMAVDRVELEYGVGLVPFLLIIAGGWRAWKARPFGLSREQGWLIAALAIVLAIPLLVSFDAFGMRALLLHLPVLKAMSVMARFWIAYIPFLCLVSGLLLDRLVARPGRRAWWAAGGILFTTVQFAATDMGYYLGLDYDPAQMTASAAAVQSGAPVPAIATIGDPLVVAPGQAPVSRNRNDSIAWGNSSVPCYEPMFGYHLEIFRMGRIAPGPVLAAKDGLLNIKNPACYTFPAANACQPGDEFRADQIAAARAFADYRPFPHAIPGWFRVATLLTQAALALTVLGLLVLTPLCFLPRRGRIFQEIR